MFEALFLARPTGRLSLRILSHYPQADSLLLCQWLLAPELINTRVLFVTEFSFTGLSVSV